MVPKLMLHFVKKLFLQLLRRSHDFILNFAHISYYSDWCEDNTSCLQAQNKIPLIIVYDSFLMYLQFGLLIFYWGFLHPCTPRSAFSSGSYDKESACNSGDQVLTPGSERSPRDRKGYTLQYSCLENSVDRGPGGIQSMGHK